MINPTLLTVENLNMRFGGIIALKDVNLTVAKNSITALIGPNGAGKTTLFNCLTGFYKASSGKLLLTTQNKTTSLNQIMGENFKLNHLIHPIDAASTLYYKMFGGSHMVARSGIARTFQNIRLFKEMSVVENLLVAQHQTINRNIISGVINSQSYQASNQHAIEKAFYWLEYFNLDQDANRLAGELAYGKQRHLEIARAMCTNPKLICLDEPAAGLNPHETQELSDVIINLRNKHQVTVLLIEHDMSMVMRISDKLYVLDYGEIISEGTPEMIRQDKRVIEAYLGIEHTNHKSTGAN